MDHLSPKENYLRVVRFAEPEYVPNRRFLPIVSVGYHGVNPEDNQPPGADAWKDFWGVGWQHMLEGVMPFPNVNPLADPQSWDSFEWPDPYDPARMASARTQVASVDRSQYLVSVSHRSTLFERAWELVGMENLLMMLASKPEQVDWLFDRIIEFQIGIARQYLELKPDIAALGDDLGTQLSLFLSPTVFRRSLKPRYSRLIDLYRDQGVMVSFHSCGNVLGLIGDFLDLGIDILNPVQARAIGDLASLRERTAGIMTLEGGVDTQYTLTLGTPDEVREEVRERIHLLAQYGGYICGPDQTIPMPEENSKALDEAITQYGRYPQFW